MQRISFLGIELDSVSWTARLTQERAQSVLNCLKTLSGRMAVSLKLFQRLLGHVAATAVISCAWLLHMKPPQHWLYGRVLRSAWQCGTHRVQITPACRRTFSLWTDPSFLWVGVPLELGNQACCVTHGCLGHRLGSHVQQARSVSVTSSSGVRSIWVAPYWPSRTWFPGTHAPRDSPSLADSSEEVSAFSEMGHSMAPVSWTGREGSRWPTPGGSSHYRFTMSTVYKTDICAEVELVHRMVFLSLWGSTPGGGRPAL